MIRVPLSWLLASASLLSSGLLVALIVVLQTRPQDTLSATAMALAVISFGAQLVLASVDYLAGIRQEERLSSIQRDTLRGIQALSGAVESNVSVTNTLSDRFNTEFQAILDHVLAATARSARNPREAELIDEIGIDLREKALEAAVSVPNDPKSRLASSVVKILHDSPTTVANSVSYSRGMISWRQGQEDVRCSAIVGDAAATSRELADLARQVKRVRTDASGGGTNGCCFIVLPVRPSDKDSVMIEDVHVTWIERFAEDLAGIASGKGT